jgi:hypothetical protein
MRDMREKIGELLKRGRKYLKLLKNIPNYQKK